MKPLLRRTLRAVYLAGGLSLAAAGVAFAGHVVDSGGVPPGSAADSVCGAVCGTEAGDPPVLRGEAPRKWHGTPRRAETEPGTVAGGLGMSAKPFGLQQLGGHLHGGLPGDVVSPKDLTGRTGGVFA